MSTEWWVFAIILLIVVVVAVTFLLLFLAYQRVEPRIPSEPQATTATLGELCRDLPCVSPFVCDSLSATCRLPNGAPCTLASDCVSTSFCSGVCTDGTFDTPLGPCPCNAPLVCVPFQIGEPALVCKGQAGATCSTGTECVGGFCVNGLCVGGGPNGAGCNGDFDCASGFCDNLCGNFGYCQDPGQNSGTLGAGCFPDSPPLCTMGFPETASCNSGLVCQVVGPTGGVCVATVSGLGSPCSSSVPCSVPLSCATVESTQCPIGTTGAGVCTCTYTFTPNACSLGAGVCTPGYLCNESLNLCLAPNTQPCSNNLFCQSGSCDQSAGVLYNLGFTPRQGTESCAGRRVQLQGATDLRWNIFTSLPPGVIPTRLTGGTQSLRPGDPPTPGNPDIMYLVDPVNGLYVSDSRDPGFSQVFPGVIVDGPSTKRLRDAFAVVTGGEVSVLVLFNETVGTITNDTLYTLTFSGSTPILTPFNVTNVPNTIPGTQFSVTGGALNITRVSFGVQTFDVPPEVGWAVTVEVGTGTSTVYTKAPGVVPYTPTLSPASNPGLYFDPRSPSLISNLSYVAPFTENGISLGTLLQFTGPGMGAVYPTEISGTPRSFTVLSYSLFSPASTQLTIGCTGPSPGGFNQSTILIVAQDDETSSIHPYAVVNGQQFPLFGFFDSSSQPLVTINGLFLTAPGQCSSPSG